MSTATPTATAALSDPETWVDRHGNALYAFAMLRLRNPTVAEEVVQETLLAAFQSRGRFQGRSSERSWLIGILKHKIIDHFRRSSRERPTEHLDAWTEDLQVPFDASGHWRMSPSDGPVDWEAQPSAVLEQREFHEILVRCLSKLPPRIAEAFSLREMDERPSEEICQVLRITPTNLWVMLHRARAQLRQCLEVNWFGRTAK